MAKKYACPFKGECDTDCSQAEVGKFLRVVANPRSRQLLSVLKRHEGGQIPLDEVLDQMSVSSGVERRKWYTEFQHSYLPRLEDLGIAEYDSNESVVRYHGCPLISEPVEMVETV